MSVIAMGAELPKGYEDCWYLQCDLWKDCYINGMRDNCPLRKLPEKHGRLIDGDELADGCDDPHWCRWLSEIEDMPTIVEAEV